MQKKSCENLPNGYFFYTLNAQNGCQVLAGSYYMVWFWKMNNKY